jgi:LacI family transcriptional regulator
MPGSLRPASRPATRADVARRAGVSTAVVSYVVNGGPRRVAPETAARVRAAIEALSYRPNINARALRKGSTELLGLVLPDITNPFFAEYALAIEVAAAAHGYLLVVANSGASGNAERRIVADLTARQVDGLILATVFATSDFNPVAYPGLPTVLVNCSSPFPGHIALGPAAQDGARQAVDHLIAVHDHTSVALIIGESSEPVPEPREQGWSDAFHTHGLPPGPILRTTFSRRGGYLAARQALRWPSRPTALFIASDQLASGALVAIREAGLRCPEDIAIVSYDGTSESEYSWPPLTVVTQPIEAMAQAAVAALLGLTEPPMAYQRFETALTIRESCGCPMARSTMSLDPDDGDVRGLGGEAGQVAEVTGQGHAIGLRKRDDHRIDR